MAIYFSWRYFVEKQKVFTIRKIAMMAIFFSIFMLQTFIGSTANNKWLNFDVATVVVIGFLLGPIEGIIYGLLCDWTGVLIQGSQPMAYYAVAYPLFGVLAGAFSRVYTKHKEHIGKVFPCVLFQSMIVLLCVVGFAWPASVPQTEPVPWWQIGLTTGIAFVALEALFIYLWRKRKDDDLLLVTFVFTVFIIGRIVSGIILKPIGDLYWWGGSNWESYPAKVSLQVLKTTYLEPINTIIATSMIYSSLFAVDQISNKKSFGIIL